MSKSESGFNDWRREIQKFVSRAKITRLFSRFISKIDRPVLRLSGGQLSATGIITGWPLVSLVTTGAKSGKIRTSPVLGIPEGQKIIIIASNFGKQQNPAWYYNAIANPQVSVIQGGKTRKYLAHLAKDEEYARYWQLAEATYFGYRLYRERAKREIPIFVLEPSTK